jgi:hypothetical protein
MQSEFLSIQVQKTELEEPEFLVDANLLRDEVF